MIDPIAASMDALVTGSPLAFAFVFLAGVITSVGPCVAPRYIAIASLATGATRLRSSGAFVVGLISAYSALGFVAGLLGSLWSLSQYIDLLLACGLFVGGTQMLLSARPSDHTCATRPTSVRSSGGPFLLGAASALIVSPCCTPVIATVVTTSTALGHPASGALLLGIFGLGHAVPLIFASLGTSQLTALFTRVGSSQAPAIIAGSLMIGLGCFYGVLA